MTVGSVVFVLLLSSVGLTDAVYQLVNGYPVIARLLDEGALCKFQFEIPKNAGSVQFQADIVSSSTLTGGVQSAIIYASHSDDVVRSSDTRLTASEAGDVTVTYSKPKPGLWTVGFYGDCNDVVCNFVFGNRYDVRVSATVKDLDNRPFVVLKPDLVSAYQLVKLREWAYFSFQLDQPENIYFEILPLLRSKLNAHSIVLRKTTLADMVNGNVGLPDDTDNDERYNVNMLTGVTLQAGYYILGVTPTSLAVSQADSAFSVIWGIGAKPQDETKLYVRVDSDTYCPNLPAAEETGEWDKCKHLGCVECTSTYGKANGCKWCENGLIDGGCYRRTEDSCPIIYGQGTKPTPDGSMCKRCENRPCSACVSEPGCSFCDASIFVLRRSACTADQCSEGGDLAHTCGAGPSQVLPTFAPTPAPTTTAAQVFTSTPAAQTALDVLMVAWCTLAVAIL